jgi:type IV secretory pathway VirJ component
MPRRRVRPLLPLWNRILLAAVLVPASVGAAGPAAADNAAPFGPLIVRTHVPDRPAERLVLFLSDDDGWNDALSAAAEKLREHMAFVVEIDTPTFIRRMEQTTDTCADPAAALTQLAHEVRRQHAISVSAPTILAGYGAGASLVYAALAAANPEDFAGGVSLNFCPEVRIKKPLCVGRGLRTQGSAAGAGYVLKPSRDLGLRWFVMQGGDDRVCPPSTVRRFAESTGAGHVVAISGLEHDYAAGERVRHQLMNAVGVLYRLAEQFPTPSIPEVADLPLVEVPAAAPDTGDVVAVIISGDGGWADIDKAIGNEIARRGIPVVGWSSIKYYWTPRTPEIAAHDLARVIDHYRAVLHKQRVLLVGYSFGADVIPFLTNRLPPETRASVAALVLIGLSKKATFEFHVASWLGVERGPHRATLPELQRLGALPIVCVVGDSETDSACPVLPTPAAFLIRLPGGHHFDGSYKDVAKVICDAVDEHALKR